MRSRMLAAALLMICAPSVLAQSSPDISRRREQLEAARREIVGMRVRLQKRLDDLPDAAETLKAADADLKARQDALEQQLTALSPPPPAGTAGAAAAPPSPFGRIVRISLDTRLGFDREDIFLGATRSVLRPDAVKATARRFVSSTVLSAESPLNRNTFLSLTVPHLYQTVRLSAPGQPARTLRANGVGDLSVVLERRLPDIGRGMSLSLGAGLQFPTGRSPFSLGAGELPTGEGFYQTLLRAGVQKIRVPLQLYGALDYQTAFSRRFDGRRERLPDSYGGQIGFAYATGPEFTAQTSVSLRKASSPLRFQPSTTEGYLTEALTYRPGGRDVYQGTVDVGLTEDSLDLWLGLSLRRGL